LRRKSRIKKSRVIVTFPRTSPGTIYLDHAATTPVDPDVVQGMLPFFSDLYGNPSSIYEIGQASRAAIDDTRLSVARVLHCQPNEIIFTGGATESDNLALRGVAWAYRLARSDRSLAPHIVTTAIEHHAVLRTVDALQRQGFAATLVEPDEWGIVDPANIEAALRPETCLISVMYANNEMGAVQPVRDIAALARERGIPFHSDAVQAAGSLSVDVEELGVDLLSLSAHKFYGPKGVGLLYVRRGTPIEFQLAGGGQEQGRRAGTENVPGIVGLGLALTRADEWRDAYSLHCALLRDRLMHGVQSAIPGISINGPLDANLRLPNNLNVSVPGVEGETMLLSLDVLGVAASAGSACTTGNTEPSHVLQAMKLPEERCRSSLRFTVGRDNTPEQIDVAIAALAESVDRARALAALTV
jgi:cysteine desulfurase